MRPVFCEFTFLFERRVLAPQPPQFLLGRFDRADARAPAQLAGPLAQLLGAHLETKGNLVHNDAAGPALIHQTNRFLLEFGGEFPPLTTSGLVDIVS